MKISATEHRLGTLISIRDGTLGALALFGNRASSQENIHRDFPQLRFVGLKQTHSDILIDSPYRGETPEGDAHWTQEEGVGLCIRTADCVPVLIADLHDTGSKSTIVAIHAGWRGVENEIIAKSLSNLKEKGITLNKPHAFIGPHIGAASFEVGFDVAKRLEAIFQKSVEQIRVVAEPGLQGDVQLAGPLYPHDDPAKARVDLLSIVQSQLHASGIPPSRQSKFVVDTFLSPTHESFRRDREHSGRQLSFIALTRSSRYTT